MSDIFIPDYWILFFLITVICPHFQCHIRITTKRLILIKFLALNSWVMVANSGAFKEIIINNALTKHSSFESFLLSTAIEDNFGRPQKIIHEFIDLTPAAWIFPKNDRFEQKNIKLPMVKFVNWNLTIKVYWQESVDARLPGDRSIEFWRIFFKMLSRSFGWIGALKFILSFF